MASSADIHTAVGRRFVSIQAILSLAIPAILLVVADLNVAVSALCGGMIATLANAFLAAKLFSTTISWRPEHLATTVYWGEIGKILLTGAMFLLALLLLDSLNVVAMFASYLLVQLAPCLVTGLVHKG